MVALDIIYKGELHCEATHLPSGATLATDAPKDNNGKGESFSPTDLVGAALGACMLTVMGIAARTLNVTLENARVRVEKEMVAAPQRRIGTLRVRLDIAGQGLSGEQKEKLEKAAMSCPVHKSLHPDITVPVTFNWEA